MPPKFNQRQRKQYLRMCENIGAHWLQVFDNDKDFYSAVYWDLLTNIWNSGGPVRKTDALGFMKTVKSAHTGGKYIETAIRKGVLIEEDNPTDARSKLLKLSLPMRRRLDAYFDAALEQVCRTGRILDEIKPSTSNR